MNDEVHDAEQGRQRGAIADVQRTVDRVLNMGRVLCYLDQVSLGINAEIKPVMCFHLSVKPADALEQRWTN